MTSTTGGSQVTAPRAKESSYLVEGAVGRYDQTPADPDADYVQVRGTVLLEQLIQSMLSSRHRRSRTASLLTALRSLLHNASAPLQVRRLFCDVMTDDERVRLCRNIGHWLGLARSDVQVRAPTGLRPVPAHTQPWPYFFPLH